MNGVLNGIGGIKWNPTDKQERKGILFSKTGILLYLNYKLSGIIYAVSEYSFYNAKILMLS